MSAFRRSIWLSIAATRRPHERVHEVRERLDESGWDTGFLVDEDRVVLAGSGGARSAAEMTSSPGQAMTLGPSTIRPSAHLRDLVERIQRQTLADEHILLGMLSVPDSVAARVLAKLGVSLAAVQATLANGAK